MNSKLIRELLAKFEEISGDSIEVTGPIDEAEIAEVEKKMGIIFHPELREYYSTFGSLLINNVDQYGPRLVNRFNSQIKLPADEAGIIIQTEEARRLCKSLSKSSICIWREDVSWMVLFNNDSGLISFYDGVKKEFTMYDDIEPESFTLESYIILKIQGAIDAELEWQEKQGK
ncbi:MAG: SMI1/KNR4 family protein [Pseudobacteriovorax sp.]|nr:SMI1/KNR4 family protein [Pseudobacteriovorax sp.]